MSNLLKIILQILLFEESEVQQSQVYYTNKISFVNTHTSFRVLHVHAFDSHIVPRGTKCTWSVLTPLFFTHCFCSDVTRRMYYGIKNPVLIPLKIGESPLRLSGFASPQKEGLAVALKGRKLKGAKKGKQESKTIR